MVNRVFTNSRGYVKMVEETPAQAPAISEGGIGTLGCSPCFVDNNLFTVSYVRSYTKNRENYERTFMDHLIYYTNIDIML